MIQLRIKENTSRRYNSNLSGSQVKTLAANAAATASKKAAQSGKADETLQRLSKRDLSYFGSDFFKENALKRIEDNLLYKSYGSLIESRKSENRAEMSYLFRERVNTLLEGFFLQMVLFYMEENTRQGRNILTGSWAYEEVRDLFKGLRSQALRDMKAARTSMDKRFYEKLSRVLLNKKEMRSFMKAMNDSLPYLVWEKPRL